jgi:hypothetical protein
MDNERVFTDNRATDMTGLSAIFSPRTKLVRRSFLWTLIWTSLLVVQPLPVKAADDYLRAITAEGERLETLGKARREEQALQQRIERQRRAAPATNQGETKDRSPTAEVTRAQFEQMLRREFPYSYALYVLLSEKEKEAVYAEYRKAGEEGVGRFLPVLRQIVRFSSEKNERR